MAAALRAGLERLAADDALRVAVLCGAGGHFCAGADLRAMADPARRNTLDPDAGTDAPMGPTRMALPKPLIAAFPQGCMRVDRAPAYRQWDLPLAQALREEGRNGLRIVHEEGLAGAERFARGEGRHGSFP